MDELFSHAHPVLLALVCADSKGGQGTLACRDFLSFRASKDVHAVPESESPVQSGHFGEEHLRILGAIEFLTRILAVVAVAAVLSQFLTEVLEQNLAPANFRIREVLHAPQLAEHHLALFLIIFDLAMGGKCAKITSAMKKKRFAVQAVAPRTASFLVISFDVFGQIHVDHVADVVLVDAHAECDGRGDDVDLIADELVLPFHTFLTGQSGMIASGSKTGVLEMIRHFLCPFS